MRMVNEPSTPFVCNSAFMFEPGKVPAWRHSRQ